MQRAEQAPLTLPERYRVRRHLATGGMASVWSADDLLLGRRVAIKILSERFAHDEVAVRRFKREARAAARVSAHPHVVTIFDVGDLEPEPGELSGRAFIVMEHLAGGTVADALRVGAVRRREAVRWLREAASALDHAHARGIVHRDIKPANFLLNPSRVLHVADFGIARMASEETITKGELFGTAAYLSPEQALGAEATGASDRYALAVAAFELLAGERPFSAPHFAAQARQHIEEPPPRITDRDRTLPADLDDVIARGMAKVPEDRFASAKEFVDTLETALSGGVVIDGAIPSPTARRSPATTRPLGREPSPVAATRRLAGATRPGGAPGVPGAPRAAGTGDTGPSDAGAARSAPGRGAAPSARSGGGSEAGRSPGGRLFAIAALLVAIAGAGWLTLSGMSGHSPAPQAESAHRSIPRTLTESRLHRAVRTATATAPPTSKPRPARTPATAPPTTTADQLQLQGYDEMLAGNYQAAIPTLQRAVSLADKSSLTYAYGLYNLGVSLLRSGNPAAAVPVLEQRLQIDNQRGQVLRMLNLALRATGKPPVGATTSGSTSPGRSATGGNSGGAGLGATGGQGGHGQPGSGGGAQSGAPTGPSGAPEHTSLVD